VADSQHQVALALKELIGHACQPRSSGPPHATSRSTLWTTLNAQLNAFITRQQFGYRPHRAKKVNW